MATICPTVTAYDPHEYREQMERIEPFAKRIHIDLMDGVFAPTTSPPLETVWWPSELQADIHLMYQRPMLALSQLVKLHPQLVVIHAESEVDHEAFGSALHEVGIRAGLAILSDTPVERVSQLLPKFEHVLIFSGKLGYHGGEVDLGLLDKVAEIRAHHPHVEIGWDGGINDQNAKQLINDSIDVLNVGGFIQKAENPKQRFDLLSAL